MNQVIFMGRLTKDPETRQTGETTITKYTLAVSRRKGDEADFIPVVAFNKSAEFAERYFKKGMRICISGHVQTGSYEKDWVKVFTWNVVADNQEFCESKKDDVLDLDKLFA